MTKLESNQWALVQTSKSKIIAKPLSRIYSNVAIITTGDKERIQVLATQYELTMPSEEVKVSIDKAEYDRLKAIESESESETVKGG